MGRRFQSVRNYRALFLVLAALGGAALVLPWKIPAPQAATGIDCPAAPRIAAPKAGEPPEAFQERALLNANEVANRFLYHAVLRVHPECAWDVSGPEIRQDDKDASEWTDGTLAVTPFVTEMPSVVFRYAQIVEQVEGGLRQNPDGELELPLYVGLSDPVSGQVVFLMVLRYEETAWEVASWSPAGLAGAPAGGNS